MKRNVIGMFSLAILTLATVGAYAQTTVQATVPFAFRVGAAHLPAGIYKIQRRANTNIVLITNTKAHVSAMVLGQADSSTKASRKLVFLHVGDQYALTNIWGEVGSQGMSFHAPKLEREKAAATMPLHTGNEVEIALK